MNIRDYSILHLENIYFIAVSISLKTHIIGVFYCIKNILVFMIFILVSE
jgi:hypothetical protein